MTAPQFMTTYNANSDLSKLTSAALKRSLASGMLITVELLREHRTVPLEEVLLLIKTTAAEINAAADALERET